MDKAFGVVYIKFVFLIGSIDKDHELGNGCVEFHRLDLLSNRFNGFVINLVKSAIVFRNDFFTCNQTVYTVKEFTASFQSFFRPSNRSIKWSHEHFIDTKGISTVLFHHIVWVDNVLEGFRHFGWCLLQLFPCFHMEERTITFFNLVSCHESTTVVTVACSQDHSLVKEFLEWLFSRYNTKVIEEFVPETSVKQVKHGVFCTTHIDIYWQPLFEKVLVSQFLCVVWINIAEVVPA